MKRIGQRRGNAQAGGGGVCWWRLLHVCVMNASEIKGGSVQL